MAGQEGNSNIVEGDEQYGALKYFLKNGWGIQGEKLLAIKNSRGVSKQQTIRSGSGAVWL